MRYLHVAERLFNQPLLISEEKLNVLQFLFGRKSGLELVGVPPVDVAEISEKERARAGYRAQNGLGIIGIHGPLMHRRLDAEFPSGGPTTYSEIRRAFDLALVDDAVQSIVLDIDSPGGEANGVFDLADHIFQARGTKPITAILNESGYSAAYLLASAAERIVLPRTGNAGSIGVIATHADFSRMEDQAGVTVTHVYAGARKADFSPHQPLSAEALAVLQERVNDAYELFVDAVARNRGLSTKDVRATEAGLFQGKKAVALKLADQVAPVDQALANASRGKGPRVIRASTEEKPMNLQQLKDNHPEVYQAAFDEGKAAVQLPDTAKLEADARAAGREEGASQERARACELLDLEGPRDLTLAAVKEGTDPGAFAKQVLSAEREGRAGALEGLKTGLAPAVPQAGKETSTAATATDDAARAAEFDAKVEAHVKEKGCAKSVALGAVIAKNPELHQAWLREKNKK